jgi:hypothetical protein
MTRLMSLQVILFVGLAFPVSVYPMASWAVVALSIQRHHEYEAAFCLGLLSEVDESISFDGKRKTQLVAESLSFAPEESMISRKGRLDAMEFVSANPDVAIFLNRTKTCNDELSAIIQIYAAHLCGFGMGSLASKWSIREVSDFYELFEGRIIFEGIDNLQLN